MGAGRVGGWVGAGSNKGFWRAISGKQFSKLRIAIELPVAVVATTPTPTINREMLKKKIFRKKQNAVIKKTGGGRGGERRKKERKKEIKNGRKKGR